MGNDNYKFAKKAILFLKKNRLLEIKANLFFLINVFRPMWIPLWNMY